MAGSSKQQESYRPDQAGGTQDITRSTSLGAPEVVTTVPDVLNMHGPGVWDNNVYGGDPYSASDADGTALDNAGPAK